MDPMPADGYYPESMYPPSIRPAPVGSEATDLQMQLPDGVVMPVQQPNPYDRYAYTPETDPYAVQHNYAYPATGKLEKPGENYGYSSSYTPHQYSAHMSDPSQQSYTNPYYSATHNNTTIVTDSQGSLQYPANSTTPNQFANNPPQVQANLDSNYGSNTNANQATIIPNQYQYDPYSQSSQANPIPDVVPSLQADLSSSFSQMHILPSKSEPAANLGHDYTQTYFSVHYPQATTPNYATYTPSMNTSANTSMVPSQTTSDYSSLNYPYSSDATLHGQIPNVSNSNVVQPNLSNPNMGNPSLNNPNMGNPSMSNPNMANPNVVNHPYSTEHSQYGQTSSHNVVNPNVGVVNPNVVNSNMANPNITHPNMAIPNVINPYPSDSTQYGQTGMPNAYITSEPQYIASSSYTNMSQGYPVYTNAESMVTSTTNTAQPGTEQTYINPALSHLDDIDKPIKSHVTREALPSKYKPGYQNYDLQSIPSSQMQSVSEQSYQPTNTYGYSDQTNVNYSQGYQNHPGYTFNSASGGYDYSYGSQNAYTTNTYDASHGNTNLQQMEKDPNLPGHGAYTNAGSHGTLQSPSETPQGQYDQTNSGNNQIYYNTPYGYITNTNQAQNQNPQAMSTNYGAHVNQSTYMQSGQGNNTNTTNTNYQVAPTTENTQDNNIEQNTYPNTYHQTQVHIQDQSLNNQSSVTGQSVQNPESKDNSYSNTGFNQNVEYNQNQSVNQSTNDGQTQNEPTNQNVTPAPDQIVKGPNVTENQSPSVSEPIPEKAVEHQQTEATETKSEPSVFDLLSDIDFTVETKTLMPEIKVPQMSESAIKKPVSKPEPIKKPVVQEAVIERPAKRDLFTDPSLMNQFTQEVKNLQRLTETLTNKAGSGLTVLDSKWKTFQDLQTKENMTRSKTVAMQHTSGNIVTEVVPYDDSRLTLKSDPDAYINASFYKQLAPWCIPIVISKNPAEEEYSIFWKAVLENKISCVVCLLSDIEMQGKSYWPTAKGQSLELSGLKATLDEVNCTVHWTERKLTITSGKTVFGVTHYQINVFPAKIVCSPLLLLVDKILSLTYKNRLSNQLSGVWIQCSVGAGRSAVIALLCMVVCQVRAGQLRLCDMLDEGCMNLCKHRSNVLEDTKYLVDAYRTALFYVQGVLCSGTTNFNGEAVSSTSGASILPPVTQAPAQTSLPKQKFSRESFEEMKQSPGLKSGDMKDPLNFLDPLWSLKKK